MDRGEELARVASGEVRTAYRAGKEGVSGDEEGVVGKIEAGAAFRVSWGMKDGSAESDDADGEVIAEVGIGRGDLGGSDSEPAGLNVHHLDEGQVELVVEDRGPGESFELLGSSDVVDVGMSDDDLAEGELVSGKGGYDTRDVVAGIYDDGFARGFVTEDRAVAAEWANDEDFVDHEVILEGFGRLRGK